LKLFDKRTAQVLFTALAFGLTLLFIYFAWRALIAFLFAVFFAYLLEAPVSRFQTWLRGSRPAAIAVVYAIFLGLLVLVFSLLGPPIAQEAQKLAQQAPEWANRITSRQIAEQVGGHYKWSQGTINRVGDFLSDHRQEMITETQSVVVRGVRSLQNTWWLFLVPILAIFFLKDGNRFGQAIVNSVEAGRDREMVSTAVEKMHTMVGHYIRSQLLLAVIAMVVITVVLSLMRVPYGVAVGPAAGALEFIPVVGPIVGGVLIFGVAFLSGYSHLLWLCLFLLVWRMVQDYVISPRIMSGTLELHPLAVLFGVLAGGEVAGVIGVFLSVPVLATLRILWHTWRDYRKPAQTEPKEQLV
jgi:predicted PurR-regulated permease PerM